IPKSWVRGMFDSYGFSDKSGMRISEVTDGLSNTILLGEILPVQLETFGTNTTGWAGVLNMQSATTIMPINYNIYIDRTVLGETCNAQSNGMHAIASGSPTPPTPCERNAWNWGMTWGFKSKHAGGANFAFSDGSVHFLSETIDMKTYQLLGCRNDGQAVNLP